MSSDEFISHSSMPGKEVARVAEAIAHVIDGEEIAVAIAACLGMAAMLQKPEIESGELQEVVLELSQFLCMMIAEGLMDIDPGKQMN